MNCYLYVDRESHYERSRDWWQSLHGPDAELDQLEYAPNTHPVQFVGFNVRRETSFEQQFLHVDPKLKLFFDVTTYPYNPIPDAPNRFDRAVYFTSFSGDDDAIYNKKVMIREIGLEPHIVHEEKQLADRRKYTLEKYNMVEKAKGVDIALAVRMIEDGYRHNYQQCFLFTSDVDYLPVIEAVRRMGKQVFVFGYKDGLGKNSPLVYLPDQFIDLGQRMIHYQRIPKRQDTQT